MQTQHLKLKEKKSKTKKKHSILLEIYKRIVNTTSNWRKKYYSQCFYCTVEGNLKMNKINAAKCTNSINIKESVKI